MRGGGGGGGGGMGWRNSDMQPRQKEFKGQSFFSHKSIPFVKNQCLK